jgi:murein L,D-transpeptidase YafK
MELILITDLLLIFVGLAVVIYFLLIPSNKRYEDEELRFKFDALMEKLGIDLDFDTELKNKITLVLNSKGEKEALSLYKKITGNSYRMSKKYLKTLIKNNK